MITEYPLTKANRIRLARAFRDVSRVDVSIDCVVEGQMGKAYVDDLHAPSAYKIQTGPFLYFAGDPAGKGGQQMLREIKPWTLFMPSSEGWLETGKSMYGERLLCVDRYSFSSDYLSLENLEELSLKSKFSREVKRMDLAFADQLWGQNHFVDISDFEGPSDFVERGIGYYVEKDEEVLGAAYSSLVCGRGIEVSIYVSEDYRRLGMATSLAAHLAGWCLKHTTDPHWDAANLGSCKLAEKLGYVPEGKYEAYYLKA